MDSVGRAIIGICYQYIVASGNKVINTLSGWLVTPNIFKWHGASAYA